jgi:DNA polymerase III delta prime subunit
MNNMQLPQNGGNMMDMLRSQLMTITMMKSMNNNSPNSPDNSMFNMLYIFIATAIIDFICKTAAPAAVAKIKKYYRDNLNPAKILDDLSTSKKDLVKSSSITIQIKISDHENVFGQALLDYITNNNNTKHITYKKQNFILNQRDVIEIADGLFVKLTENNTIEAQDKAPTDIEQMIELFSYSKTTHQLRAFLNKITYDYELKLKNKLGDNIYYFNQHPMNVPADATGAKDYSKLPNNCIFTMKKFQTNRKFSNLFGPEISVVKKRVEFFIKNKNWYDEKGIPYTLGLLLSGQAGAGKTSSVKCLANETGRHIVNINLNNDITKTQLDNLFFNEVISVLNPSTSQTEKYSIPLDQRIYVLEDIDCQSDLVMERTLKSPTQPPEQPEVSALQSVKTNPGKPDTYGNKIAIGSEKLDLSFLLNILDGVLEIPGRIVIMTSNYIEQLDRALIRPGRIDIIADFKKCVNQTLIEMIEFFFDIQLNGSEKARLMALKEYIVSPAEMGKIMFENFNDYANVIVELERISQTTCAKKTKPSKPIEKKMGVEENFITLTNESPIMDTVEKYNSLMKPPSTYEPVNKNDPGMMQWNMEPYLPTSGSAFAQYV